MFFLNAEASELYHIISYHLDLLWRPILSSEAPYKVKFRLNNNVFP